MSTAVAGHQVELLETVVTPLFTGRLVAGSGHSLGHVFATGIVMLIRPQEALRQERQRAE